MLLGETRAFLSSSVPAQNQSVHLKDLYIWIFFIFYFLEERGIDVLYSTDIGFDVTITTWEISLDPCQKIRCARA